MTEHTDHTSTTRRRLLKLTGGALAVGGASGVASATGPGGTNFRVRGREVKKVKIRPEEVEYRVRKTSPALKERYGFEKGTISKTETYERPKPDEDDLPERDTRTFNRKWDAHIAEPGEWKEAFGEEDDEKAGSATGSAAVGATALSYREDDYDFGLYEYEQTDGLYEQVAPMNVISPYAMSSVVNVLTDNGYTGIVVQYNRHAYNSDVGEFQQQHDSAATGTFGFLGRKHAKFWEFGSYVSCSAHVDSSVPHEAISHEDAEQHIEGVFDDAAYWYGDDDYYDVNNGSFLDHDGSATGLF
jgi:hypothetical protein